MLRQDLDDNQHYTLEQLADLHGLTLCEFARILQDYTPLPHRFEDGLRGWELKMLAYWRKQSPVMRQHKPVSAQYFYAH